MKILLINVSLRPNSPLKLFPTGLAYIASAIERAGFNLEILDIDANRYADEQIQTFLKKTNYDVVAIGCIVTGYKIVKDLTALIKKINSQAIIVVGNTVGSSIPEILLDKTDADIVVLGEGDVTIVDLLQHLSQNKSLEDVQGIYFKSKGHNIKNDLRPLIKDMNTIEFPKWDLFDMETYIIGGRPMLSEPLPLQREQIRPFQVNTARGCLFKCTFCYHAFKGQKYRHRSPDSIVSEMRLLQEQYGINYIHFWDELTFFSIPQANDIVDALLQADLGLYWTADVRGNMFKDDFGLSVARKMKKSGCIGLGYSLESANKEILTMMEKKITPQEFITQKRILDQAELASWTSLVFGYPLETKETIQETFDCCLEADIYPSTGYLLPQPGTVMYDYAIEYGFIKDEEEYLIRLGDRQDLRLNLTSMSDEEFEQNIQEGLDKLNLALGVGLSKGELLKTSHYRQKNNQNSSEQVEH